MKKILLLFLPLLLVTSCGRGKQDVFETTWYIEKPSGEVDTIEAKQFWILTGDSLFIVFRTRSGEEIIYSREGVTKFKRKN